MFTLRSVRVCARNVDRRIAVFAPASVVFAHCANSPHIPPFQRAPWNRKPLVGHRHTVATSLST
eukprot:6499648-Lingulodinium_polyedra.AAC.1